jgi:hypothetical protein
MSQSPPPGADAVVADATPRRRRSRRSSSPVYICDRCWRAAQTITVLPGLHRPRVARVTCWDHQPESGPLGGAYGFRLGEWFDMGPDWRDHSRRYSMRDHWLDTKIRAAEAVDLVEAALARSLRDRIG